MISLICLYKIEVTIQPPRLKGTKEKIDMNSTMDRLPGFPLGFNMLFAKRLINRLIP